MLRFCLLSSGSAGNALLVASATTKILIDVGLSFRQLHCRAEAVGESLDGLRAVFITHEHNDHVSGAGVLARRTGIPFHMTPGTAAGLPSGTGAVSRVALFEAGDAVSVDDMIVTSFPVSHDAADPVGYVVESGGA
ncbi:MAG TPA: MBL fold metallo-hydrolase, partial [Candidatus Hydrogenedentes bacterium]|nr:MBL fold metallo-hydrolase [Candidatus Hydrogenedentota bacterium]